MIADYILSESKTSQAIGLENIAPTNNGYDVNGGMETILMESLQDFHKLNIAMNVVDYKSLQILKESKDFEKANVLQESAIGDFFKKIKELILKMWAKIQEFFENAKKYFMKFASADKFIKEYREEILKADTSDFKFEGYEYKHDAIDILNPNDVAGRVASKYNVDIKVDPKDIITSTAKLADADLKKANEDQKEASSKKEEIMDGIRASLLGESGTLSISEFKEKAMEKLRGGAEKKELSISPGDIVKTVEDYKKNEGIIEGIKSKIKGSTSNIVSYIDKCDSAKSTANSKATGEGSANTVGNNTLAINKLKFNCDILKDTYSEIAKLADAKISALKEECTQAKNIAYKLMSHSKKMKNANASYAAGVEGDGQSLLESIMASM